MVIGNVIVRSRSYLSGHGMRLQGDKANKLSHLNFIFQMCLNGSMSHTSASESSVGQTHIVSFNHQPSAVNPGKPWTIEETRFIIN